MNWQARATPISLSMLFSVTPIAILTANFFRQIKTRTKMSRFMTKKMLLIHAQKYQLAWLEYGYLQKPRKNPVKISRSFS